MTGLKPRRHATRPRSLILLTANRKAHMLVLAVNRSCLPRMGDKTDVLYGALGLMVLRTLDSLGPQHGYGLARRIEQMSDDALALNQGTLYPALLRLEQQGCITSKWGVSENNRRARFYSITRRGRRQLAAETERWEQLAGILVRFLRPVGDL
jgi:PadR family transcriptional regulator, regulatory protein PadR